MFSNQVPINFKIGCRNCLYSPLVTQKYQVLNSFANDFTDRTEYDVMKEVEKWRKDDGHVCNHCGSEDVEVFDISVGDHKLYDFQRIKNSTPKELILNLNIQKSNGNTKLDIGAANFLDGRLACGALETTIKVLNEYPKGSFSSHVTGHFFICFTGIENGEFGQLDILVQKFSCHGLTENEVLEIINNWDALMRQELFP